MPPIEHLCDDSCDEPQTFVRSFIFGANRPSETLFTIKDACTELELRTEGFMLHKLATKIIFTLHQEL